MYNIKDKTIGIALSGGGAKGAYQIGALKAIEEFGLLDLCKHYSGTSVGALNTFIYPKGYKFCKDIWDKIDKKTILTPKMLKKLSKEDAIKLGIIAVNSVIMSSVFPAVGAIGSSLISKQYPGLSILQYNLILTYILNNDEGGIFTREGLLKILDKINLDVQINYKYYITTCLLNKQNLPSKTVYHEIKRSSDHTDKDIKTLLLASSALPIIFKPEIFKGKKHMDGGIMDILKKDNSNFPVVPLKSNCDVIVGVDLSSNEKKRFINREKCNIYISPSEKFIFNKTLNFNDDMYYKMLNLGYEDALTTLCESDIARAALDLKNERNGVIYA